MSCCFAILSKRLIPGSPRFNLLSNLVPETAHDMGLGRGWVYPPFTGVETGTSQYKMETARVVRVIFHHACNGPRQSLLEILVSQEPRQAVGVGQAEDCETHARRKRCNGSLSAQVEGHEPRPRVGLQTGVEREGSREASSQTVRTLRERSRGNQSQIQGKEDDEIRPTTTTRGIQDIPFGTHTGSLPFYCRRIYDNRHE